MKVLLLSAYAARSHVQWRRSLQQMFGAWQWEVLELPPRYFSWRTRGNPLHWSIAERECLERDYELLLATSMVDLATLRGLVPALSRLPSVLYFHENQFDYPQDRQRHSLLEARMVSLYSALAADKLVFNSAYNRDSFLAGCGAMLAGFPDRVPVGIVADLADKAAVLPVPIDLQAVAAATPAWPGRAGTLPGRPLRLLWSGRFEHDKGGDQLLRVLQALEAAGLDYELALVGQQFRNSPAVFDEIAAQFSHRLVQFGYLADRQTYLALMRAADVVLATALHEFQGLAVLEAVAAGCLPVVPARLSYPGIYPPHSCYPCRPGDAVAEARGAAELIGRLAGELAQGPVSPPDVTAFGQDHLRARYHDLLAGLAGAAG